MLEQLKPEDFACITDEGRLVPGLIVLDALKFDSHLCEITVDAKGNLILEQEGHPPAMLISSESWRSTNRFN